MESQTALWDERQVAAHFNISVRTVQRWRADGDGPIYIKLSPHTVRYSPSAISAFEKSRAFDCRAAEFVAA